MNTAAPAMNSTAKTLRPTVLLAACLMACACSNLPQEFEARGPGGLLFEHDDTVALWTAEAGTQVLLPIPGGGLGGLNWSPNAGHFLLASNFGGVPLLGTATPAGTVSELPALGLDGAVQGATWSPRGDLIAFHISGWTVGTGGVYLVPADGHEAPRRLTDEAGFDAQWVAWSPDAQRLAVAAETHQEIQDESHVIWVERSAELELVDVASGSRERLTELGGNVEQISWSPDGERIAFKADGALYVISAAGGEPRLLTRGLANHGTPAWSPDGSSLAVFERVARDKRVEGGPEYWILVVPLDGEPRRYATTDTPWHIAWSPDGSELARTEGARLILLEVASGTETVLEEAIGYGSRLDWR